MNIYDKYGISVRVGRPDGAIVSRRQRPHGGHFILCPFLKDFFFNILLDFSVFLVFKRFSFELLMNELVNLSQRSDHIFFVFLLQKNRNQFILNVSSIFPGTQKLPISFFEISFAVLQYMRIGVMFYHLSCRCC